MSETKKFHYMFIFSFIAIAILYLSFINPYPDSKYFNLHDPFVYLSEAENLAKFGSYGLFDGDLFMPTQLQPPGFAILLTPIVYLFGFNFFAIKLCLICIGLITTLVSYYFFRIYTDRYRSLFCMLIFALSPITFLLSRVVLAEIPFICCTMLALIGLNMALLEDKPAKGLALGVLSTVCAIMLKGLAVALLFSPLLTLLVLKKRRFWKYYLIYFILSALPLVYLLIRNMCFKSYGFWGHGIFWHHLRSLEGHPLSSVFTILATHAYENITWHGIYCMLQFIFPLAFPSLSLARQSNPSEIMKYLALIFMGILFCIFILRIRTRKNLLLEGACIFGLLILLPFDDGGALRYWFASCFLLFIIYMNDLNDFVSKFIKLISKVEIKVPIFLLIILLMIIPALNREIIELRDPFMDDVSKSYAMAGDWVRKNIDVKDRYFIVDGDPTRWHVLSGGRTLAFVVPINKSVSGLEKKDLIQIKMSIVALKENKKSGLILNTAKTKKLIYSNDRWNIYDILLDDDLVRFISSIR